jgi:3-oxoadipate CoA-transferase alpha subunit
MINKITSDIEPILKAIPDGATIMTSGFGVTGQPAELIEALIDLGKKELTIVNNNAASGDRGLTKLIIAGCVRKMICSFPKSAGSTVFQDLYRAGKIELELVPQGNLACRIQAAGAGLGAIFTPTGYGTKVAEGKETRTINGKNYVLEYPLEADFALIYADKADRWGNLTYRKAARNFGPIMAKAAKTTIVQVNDTVELGTLDLSALSHREFCSARCQSRRYLMSVQKRSREDIAKFIANDIPEGSYVNLGIGLPTNVAKFLPKDKEIFLHSENGVLAFGPPPKRVRKIRT